MTPHEWLAAFESHLTLQKIAAAGATRFWKSGGLQVEAVVTDDCVTVRSGASLLEGRRHLVAWTYTTRFQPAEAARQITRFVAADAT